MPHPTFPMLSRFAVGLSLALSVGYLCGCTCSGAGSDGDLGQGSPLAPLRVEGTPPHILAELHPVEGASRALPVALVLSKIASDCTTVRGKLAPRAHTLCLSREHAEAPDAGEKAEGWMKEALLFFKKQYPAHVSSAPVFLITDQHLSELGFRLMLKEPQFFAHAFLPGLDSSLITSSSLFALFDRGAMTLVFEGKQDERVRRLQKMAKRRAFRLELVDPGPATLSTALDLLISRDPRIFNEQVPNLTP